MNSRNLRRALLENLRAGQTWKALECLRQGRRLPVPPAWSKPNEDERTTLNGFRTEAATLPAPTKPEPWADARKRMVGSQEIPAVVEPFRLGR